MLLNVSSSPLSSVFSCVELAEAHSHVNLCDISAWCHFTAETLREQKTKSSKISGNVLCVDAEDSSAKSRSHQQSIRRLKISTMINKIWLSSTKTMESSGFAVPKIHILQHPLRRTIYNGHNFIKKNKKKQPGGADIRVTQVTYATDSWVRKEKFDTWETPEDQNGEKAEDDQKWNRLSNLGRNSRSVWRILEAADCCWTPLQPETV